MRYRTGLLRGLTAAMVLGFVSAAAYAEDKDKKADPTGTWKWSFTSQQGQTFESTLKLRRDGDKLAGTYTGRGGQEIAVEDLKYEAGDLAFKVTRERDGQKFTARYRGKVSADTIKGQVETDFGGQNRTRDWEAKRAEDKK